MINQIKSLSDAFPGDLIFYARKEGKKTYLDLTIEIGQLFWSTISSQASTATHVGIIINPIFVDAYFDSEELREQIRLPGEHTLASLLREENRNRYVWISHSYATGGGAQISVKEKRALEEEYQISVISPITPGVEWEGIFRDNVTFISLCFSRVVPHFPILPCSPYHLFVTPNISPSVLPSEDTLQSIAMSAMSYIAECPDIEKFDDKGAPIVKKTFCAEYVHRVLQVAYFLKAIGFDKANQMAWDYHHRYSKLSTEQKYVQTQSELNENYQEITRNLIGLYQESDTQVPPWILQNSTSCSPGRLFTLLTEGPDFRISVVSRVKRVSGNILNSLPIGRGSILNQSPVSSSNERVPSS